MKLFLAALIVIVVVVLVGKLIKPASAPAA
jgi:hypothetical protein